MRCFAAHERDVDLGDERIGAQDRIAAVAKHHQALLNASDVRALVLAAQKSDSRCCDHSRDSRNVRASRDQHNGLFSAPSHERDRYANVFCCCWICKDLPDFQLIVF